MNCRKIRDLERRKLGIIIKNTVWQLPKNIFFDSFYIYKYSNLFSTYIFLKKTIHSILSDVWCRRIPLRICVFLIVWINWRFFPQKLTFQRIIGTGLKGRKKSCVWKRLIKRYIGVTFFRWTEQLFHSKKFMFYGFSFSFLLIFIKN